MKRMNTIHKRLLSLAIVLALVLSLSPVITLPAAAAETTGPVSAIVAAQSGSVRCEGCKRDIAWNQWTPITLQTLGCSAALDTATTFAMQADTHYYLAEDINVFTATAASLLSVASSGGKVCLHLNGKTLRNVGSQADLDATGANTGNNVNVGSTGTGEAIHITQGTLNLMGDGYVASRGNGILYAPVYITSGASVNVYGGTYNNHRRDRACFMFDQDGGNLTIYDGIFQDPFGTRAAGTAAGNITIHGGTLTANYIFESSGTAAMHSGSKLTITGGTFNLNTDFMETAMDKTIKPVITGGTFNMDPSDFVSGCFAVEGEGPYTVAESHNYGEDNVCSDCGDVQSELPVFDPESNDGKAYCQACYRQGLDAGLSKQEAKDAALADWTIYTGQYDSEANALTADDHPHYYLTEDYRYYGYGFWAKAPACFNLNGCDFTVGDSGATAFITTSLLNIMDTEGGSVVRGGNYPSVAMSGAAIYLNDKDADVHLYGGTYTKKETLATRVVVSVMDGGTVTAYEDAVIDTSTTSGVNNSMSFGRCGSCVYLVGSDTVTDTTGKATFNLKGGTILGYSGNTATDSTYLGSAVSVGGRNNKTGTNAEFNLYSGTVSGGGFAEGSSLSGGNFSVVDGNVLNILGGTVSGGVAANGGNIYVANGTVNISGDARIYGGVASSSGGNIYVAADGVVNMSGGEIYGTAYNPNAKEPVYDAGLGGCVYVKDGAFCMSGTAKVYNGAASSQAGNFYLRDSAKLTMTGSAQVYGGVSASRGGNIRGYTSNTSAKTPLIIMDGDSKVYDGLALNSTNHEDNLWLGNTDILMKGNAVIRGSYDAETGKGVTKSAIGMAGGSMLILDGNATVANEGVDSSNVLRSSGAEDLILIAKTWTGTAYMGDDLVADGRVLAANGYCGTYDPETLVGAKDETAAGVFSGKLYVQDVPVVPVKGDLLLAQVAVVDASGETFHTSATDALTAYGNKQNAYLKLYACSELNLSGNTYLDINGREATATGTGKLYLMDSATDDYVGNVALHTANTLEIVRDVVNPVTGYRYINVTVPTGIAETVDYKSYRLDMKLSSVTLRAGKTSEGMGLYYKATISCPEALTNYIGTYGVVLSLADMPGANFMTERNANGALENGFTSIETRLPVSAANGYTVTLNSGSVFGIMKADAAMADANVIRGEMPIFANAYLYIDFNGDGSFDADEFLMSDTDTDTANDIAWSLFNVMDAIDNRWSDFTAAQQKVTSFYSFWHEYGMKQWTFDNIKKA